MSEQHSHEEFAVSMMKKAMAGNVNGLAYATCALVGPEIEGDIGIGDEFDLEAGFMKAFVEDSEGNILSMVAQTCTQGATPREIVTQIKELGLADFALREFALNPLSQNVFTLARTALNNGIGVDELRTKALASYRAPEFLVTVHIGMVEGMPVRKASMYHPTLISPTRAFQKLRASLEHL